METENPTQSAIEYNYVCAPHPFPFMQINLDNDSLVVMEDIIIEWVFDTAYIPPGITTRNLNIGFAVLDYNNKQLPVGEYRFWFNYSVCTELSIPVIIEGMTIDVNETNVRYLFEHNNSTKVFDLPTEPSTSETQVIFFLPAILILVGLRKKVKLKKILETL